MQPRQIFITIGVLVVAFGVAFGIGKASGGEEKAVAGNGTTPETIEVSSAAISASVATEKLPALKPKPKPKKEEPEESTSTSTSDQHGCDGEHGSSDTGTVTPSTGSTGTGTVAPPSTGWTGTAARP